MNEITFIILIIIIVCILALIYAIYYNNFQKYLIKINEVESKIDITLRQRFDLLDKAAEFLKEHIKEEVMTDLSSLKDMDISNFDLERKLIAITKEFYSIKISHRNLVKLDSFINIDFTLKENEAELEGYTSYYNDCISKFNKLVRMFPSNIVAKTSKFKEKTFFDGKDMTDEKVDDFKL